MESWEWYAIDYCIVKSMHWKDDHLSYTDFGCSMSFRLAVFSGYIKI